MDTARRHSPYLLFMLLLSLLALGILGLQTVVKLDPGTQQILNYADTVVCLLFFLDFLYSFYHAHPRWRYLYTWGWLDLISSIPVIEPLRVARAARVIRILRVLRGLRASRILTVFIIQKRAQSAFMAAMLLGILLVATSAVAVLHFEADTAGTIKSPEDALWWSIATITGVGTGNQSPQSAEGRTVAAFMMLASVGLFATVSGLVASWFLAPGQADREVELTQLREALHTSQGQLHEIHAELSELKALLYAGKLELPTSTPRVEDSVLLRRDATDFPEPSA